MNSVGDKKRFMPYHFVQKTLCIIFGMEGYFESLLGTIDSTLVSHYRKITLAPLDGFPPIKLVDVGSFAIERGLEEIKTRNISKAMDTEINKLFIYALYNKFVASGVQCLASIKTKIIKELDSILMFDSQEMIHWSSIHSNEKLTNIVFSEINDFAEKTDISYTADTLYSSPFSPSPASNSRSLFFLPKTAPLNTALFYSTAMIIALIISMNTERRDWQLATSLVFATSFIGFTNICFGFFSGANKTEDVHSNAPTLQPLH